MSLPNNSVTLTLTFHFDSETVFGTTECKKLHHTNIFTNT